MQIGPYKLLVELGCGGMAQLYLANRIWENGDRRACVFKIPRRKAVADEAQMRQFSEEGRVSKKLRHRNIVSVFDEGVHDGLPYLVMDFIAGVDLEQLHRASVQASGPWDIDPAIYVIREMGQALHYAHKLEEQLVHRDVSSKNIMIDGTGGVFLMDFGIATSVHSMTSQMHVKGTLSYMAPEHYLGRACPASDVFGLGVVFWELLSGRRYREGLEREALGKAIVEGHIEPLNRELPSEVRHVLMGMLEPRAENRMTVVEMLHAFKRYPNCAVDLEDLVALHFGRAGRRTGVSSAHFAASKELMEAFAVAKASPVVLSEARKPGVRQPPNPIPEDYVPVPHKTTTRIDPGAMTSGFDDDLFDDEVIPAPTPEDSMGIEPPPTSTPATPPVAATLVQGKPEAAHSKGDGTVRLEPSYVVEEPANAPNSELGPTLWLPPPQQESPSVAAENPPEEPAPEADAPTEVPWPPSTPGAVTLPPVQSSARTTEPHSSAGIEGPSEARSGWDTRRFLLAALVPMVLALGGLGVWLSARPDSEETSGDAVAEASRADVESPDKTPAPESAAHLPEEGSPPQDAEEDPLEVPEPEAVPPVAAPVGPDPSVDTPEEPPPLSAEPEVADPPPKAEAPAPKQARKRRPKPAAAKLDLVVRRGLGVTFAEFRINRGKVHAIPARGGTHLQVRPGTFTLRYRSEEAGPWKSTRQVFASGMTYAAHVERTTLWVTSAPKEVP